MAEKLYEVLPGCRYGGKTRVFKEGQKFPESELAGGKENIELALNGQKFVEGKKPAKKPVIKAVSASEAKKASGDK
jgi:hypothetical protein